jgi:hypothetical protein
MRERLGTSFDYVWNVSIRPLPPQRPRPRRRRRHGRALLRGPRRDGPNGKRGWRSTSGGAQGSRRYSDCFTPRTNMVDHDTRGNRSSALVHTPAPRGARCDRRGSWPRPGWRAGRRGRGTGTPPGVWAVQGLRDFKHSALYRSLESVCSVVGVNAPVCSGATAVRWLEMTSNRLE